MPDAEIILPVATQAAYALQRLQQLPGFMADFLSMHFHAQADQCLAHFPGSGSVAVLAGSWQQSLTVVGQLFERGMEG